MRRAEVELSCSRSPRGYGIWGEDVRRRPLGTCTVYGTVVGLTETPFFTGMYVKATKNIRSGPASLVWFVCFLSFLKYGPSQTCGHSKCTYVISLAEAQAATTAQPAIGLTLIYFGSVRANTLSISTAAGRQLACSSKDVSSASSSPSAMGTNTCCLLCKMVNTLAAAAAVSHVLPRCLRQQCWAQRLTVTRRLTITRRGSAGGKADGGGGGEGGGGGGEGSEGGG